MFAHVQKLPDDPILKLSQLYAQDARSPKVDVGVGIFQDENGHTPIMRAVQAAEKTVWEKQTSKKYQGLLGNIPFDQALTRLVLGQDYDQSRVRAIQTVAGTGALRLIGEALRAMNAPKRLWVSDPTWGNHLPIFRACGFEIHTYPYYNRESATLKRDEFFAAMRELGQEDIVLLHGCCHNPSGQDLSPADWDELAALAVERGFLPIVDLAYLGFGEGLEKDAYGVRKLAASVPNLFIAVSCSKNFGLYRERVGLVIALGKNSDEADAIISQLGGASRAKVSMPPDHGAEVVATILNTPALRADWESELRDYCAYIRRRREELAAALEKATGTDWRFVVNHRGMFSLLPLGKERVERLREEFAIYVVGEGRINIAGLRSQEAIDYFADSVKKTAP